MSAYLAMQPVNFIFTILAIRVLVTCNFDCTFFCEYEQQQQQSFNQAIFQDNPGKPIPEFHYLRFYWNKVDGDGGKTGAVRCAKLQLNHPTFYIQMHFLSPNQQCQSTEGRKCHISWTWSPQPHLLPSLSWPLKAPGYLGWRLWNLLSALWHQYLISNNNNTTMISMVP